MKPIMYIRKLYENNKTIWCNKYILEKKLVHFNPF